MDSFFIAHYMANGTGLYNPDDLELFHQVNMITDDTYNLLKGQSEDNTKQPQNA